MNRVKLKSCPFCDGDANIQTIKDFQGRIFSATVECCECNASTRSYITIEAAVEAWNKRCQSA